MYAQVVEFPTEICLVVFLMQRGNVIPWGLLVYRIECHANNADV